MTIIQTLVVPTFPALVDSYVRFCSYRRRALATKQLDLSDAKWFYPTTLLPLGNFISENKSKIEYIPPTDNSASTYLSIVLQGSPLMLEYATGNYCPLVSLPVEKESCEPILQHLYRLQDNGKFCGGELAFKYIIGELVDNIYEHSSFTNALVMAQGYKTKKFVEMCFFDNGITIPGAFKRYGLTFKDFEAIAEAINGLTTKPGAGERGYGLGSSLKIVANALKGQTMVVSKHGAIYMGGGSQTAYTLAAGFVLDGTLISIRIPTSTNVVNIYDYLK